LTSLGPRRSKPDDFFLIKKDSSNYKKEIKGFAYCADQPPSTGIAVPVLNEINLQLKYNIN